MVGVALGIVKPPPRYTCVSCLTPVPMPLALSVPVPLSIPVAAVSCLEGETRLSVPMLRAVPTPELRAVPQNQAIGVGAGSTLHPGCGCANGGAGTGGGATRAASTLGAFRLGATRTASTLGAFRLAAVGCARGIDAVPEESIPFALPRLAVPLSPMWLLVSIVPPGYPSVEVATGVLVLVLAQSVPVLSLSTPIVVLKR